MSCVIIGYLTEGSTDERFLKDIIKRTFDEIAYNCQTIVEVFEPKYLKSTAKTFIEQVVEVSKLAESIGINVLCIHTDADSSTSVNTYTHKINPAIIGIDAKDHNYCKNLVAVVPVRMTEAWMLADHDLLIKELNSRSSASELCFPKSPETISDPKYFINETIRNIQSNQTKRRRTFDISELYGPIGKKISLEKLKKLDSYKDFYSNVENAYRKLNYLR